MGIEDMMGPGRITKKLEAATDKGGGGGAQEAKGSKLKTQEFSSGYAYDADGKILPDARNVFKTISGVIDGEIVDLTEVRVVSEKPGNEVISIEYQGRVNHINLTPEDAERVFKQARSILEAEEVQVANELVLTEEEKQQRESRQQESVLHHLNFLINNGYYEGKGGSREFLDSMRDKNVADLRRRLTREIRDYGVALAEPSEAASSIERDRYIENKYSRESTLSRAKELLDAMDLVIPGGDRFQEGRMSLVDLRTMLRKEYAQRSQAA